MDIGKLSGTNTESGMFVMLSSLQKSKNEAIETATKLPPEINAI